MIAHIAAYVTVRDITTDSGHRLLLTAGTDPASGPARLDHREARDLRDVIDAWLRSIGR